MPKGSVCAKCMVGWAIRETIKEYLKVIDALKAKQEIATEQDLWAYYEGKINVFVDVIDDHKALIPYLQTEVSLRARGNKGV